MKQDPQSGKIPSLITKISHSLKKIREKKQSKAKNDWNRQLVGKITRSKKKLPSHKQLKKLPSVLRAYERFAIKACFLLIVVSLGFLCARFYFQNSELLPAPGGEYTEGVIGQPQFINPAFAPNNEVDMDLTRLIFSGLLQYNERLELETDLALSYEISDDGLQYIFYLNENVLWHDGEQLTADDVIFTTNVIKDPQYLSPLQVNFRGVTVEKLDDYTVTFTLKEPFAPFLNSLTFGILPQHKWGEVAPKNFTLAKTNLEPVGTGPFKADRFKRDDLGNIKSYTLERNENYYGKKPYLEKVTFKFYQTIDSAIEALNNKNVMALSIVPKEQKSLLKHSQDLNFYSLLLPQYNALFFNLPESELLKEQKIRKALALAINRNELVSEVFGNEAQVISGPILPGFIGYNAGMQGPAFDTQAANTLLDEAGWKIITPAEYQALIVENQKKIGASESPSDSKTDDESASQPSTSTILNDKEIADFVGQQEFYRQKGDGVLELNITTVAHSENIEVAKKIQKYWQNIGVRVDLFTVDSTKINSEIIKPRLYNVLFYAEVVGSDPDPYPYWHSSQIKDPGLNLSGFAHKKIDTLIEDARLTTDSEKREELYFEFQNILNEELPAIFLYYPTYNYVVDTKIKNLSAQIINLPSDRFSDIENRFMKTTRKIQWENWKQFLVTR